MSNPFFDHPILNSPYAPPTRHWELDEAGQPTQKIIDLRRGAKFVTPIPKPKKRKAAVAQCTPQPLKCFLQRLSLTSALARSAGTVSRNIAGEFAIRSA